MCYLAQLIIRYFSTLYSFRAITPVWPFQGCPATCALQPMQGRQRLGDGTVQGLRKQGWLKKARPTRRRFQWFLQNWKARLDSSRHLNRRLEDQSIERVLEVSVEPVKTAARPMAKDAGTQGGSRWGSCFCHNSVNLLPKFCGH